VEARNHLEALVHATEKSLAEQSNVPAAVKTEVETAIAAGKEAVKGEEVEKIKAATQRLAQVSLKIGEAVYGGQHAGAGASAKSGDGKASDSGGDNVVDADFEEVKDDKKKSA
jgi:molecular chaperone DnaK